MVRLTLRLPDKAFIYNLFSKTEKAENVAMIITDV